MTVRGGDVNSKEINRFTGCFEGKARISEHDNPEGYQENGYDGLSIHNCAGLNALSAGNQVHEYQHDGDHQ